ncbi:MAG TPA: hypothetical protein VH251_07980, partial [Verrucomicrobiae bacterium]|nr:hypothetical protein [Verrucomicrobiae bacterium]
SSFAQTNPPPATGDSTNQFSVTLWLPRAGEPVQAPATIHLFASLTSSMPGKKGDMATVDFFAGAKPIGTGKALWHDGVRPNMHSNKPQPMIVSRPGFSFASMIWSNVPAGAYVLTGRASLSDGETAVSPPVNITVQP